MHQQPCLGIDVTDIVHPKRGHLSRLSWRGWLVDVDRATCTATVPIQPTGEQRLDDLATLLGAAYRILDVSVGRGVGPADGVRSRLPNPVANDVVAMLGRAQTIAEAHWHWRSFDVYHCTRQAWQEAGMTVPYALPLAALRSVLPAGVGTLAAFNDQGTRSTIHALYDEAIGGWSRGARSRPTPRARIA